MIAHAVDFATYRQDIDGVLAEHLALAQRINREPKCWDAWIVPSEHVAAAVRNDVWLQQGWTTLDIRVEPSLIRMIRRHRAPLPA